ncbi:MAG TPA: Stk1 family PASTA domain-containing Ser/Thr kinase, partial [Bacilli bacterium]|nr:Stk1 family PASTA domain-containing Ser/Thr kinase [Bacilli bacterium]
DLASDEKFVRRFQREALSASSLNHPNIVEMYDVGEDNGSFYIVMEYVEGKMLKQIVKKRGALTISETIDISNQIMDGLSHAHDSYIIHRDIKPQNILIKDSGLVKITDFGIALALNTVELTQTNSVMGSVHYFPPEQANGKSSTIKSDIYSLGIVMFEMLTGKLPYKGENAVEIALKHMKEPLPSVRELNPQVPQSLENLILKATAKNPKNRYNDIKDMQQDLKTVLDDSRKNEDKIVFKYSESEYDDSKTTTILKEKEKKKEPQKPVVKEIKKEVIEENKNKITLAVILSGAFALLLIFLIFILPMLTRIPDVKIPNVTNMSAAEAQGRLVKAGFIVTEKTKASDVIEEGKVVETSPKESRYAKKGSKVIMYVSSGTEKIVIENYVGENVYEVKAKLELLGLDVSIEKKSITNSADYINKEEDIIDQDPAEGVSLEQNDQIILYVPDVFEIYPDFTDGTWNIEKVTAFCEKNSLTLSIEYIESANYDPDTIVGQTPAAESEIYTSSKVTITVTKAVTEEE